MKYFAMMVASAFSAAVAAPTCYWASYAYETKAGGLGVGATWVLMEKHPYPSKDAMDAAERLLRGGAEDHRVIILSLAKIPTSDCYKLGAKK